MADRVSHFNSNVRNSLEKLCYLNEVVCNDITLMAYDSCEHDGNFEDIHDSNFILEENSVVQ